MEEQKLKHFKDQIWVTRVSRINAEKRLIEKENFCQGINIYYSCVTIIFSILSLYNEDAKLSLMTVFMTVSLLIVILYLNGQKYLEHAREYRKNYTDIHELEFQLGHLSGKEEDKIQDIEQKYCRLLDSSSNHIPYDYYRTVHESSRAYREQRWKDVRWKYYFQAFWRFAVKIILVILPAVLFCIYEVF